MSKDNLKLIFALTQKRINEPRSKLLHSSVQAFVQIVRERHYGRSYLITILFPEAELLGSWNDVPTHVNKLTEVFSKLQTAYAVIGVEMHRSKHKRVKPKQGRSKGSSKTQKAAQALQSAARPPLMDVTSAASEAVRQESEQEILFEDWVSTQSQGEGKAQPTSFNNSMKGHSHVHAFLTLYNGFLAPSVAELSQLLLDVGFIDVQLDEVPYGNDQTPLYQAKKAFLYCVKEAKDQEYSYFVKQNTSLVESVIIVCGLPAIATQLDNVRKVLAQNNIKTEAKPFSLVERLPAVAYNYNNVVVVTEFLGKIMAENNLRLCPGSLYLHEPAGAAKYTYVPTKITLANAYTSLWKRLPPLSSMLQQSAGFVLQGLSDQKLELLPTIYPDAQQVELSGGVYDFRLGTFQTAMARLPREESSCCTYWPAETFASLTFPTQTLDFLEVRCDRAPLEFMLAFGALFHEHLTKPGPKALFIHGHTGTAKTEMGDRVLAEVFGEQLIGRMPPFATRFQLADLLNSWVTIMNDFTLKGYNHEQLMNLLEGGYIFLEEKYKQGIKQAMPRTVITSNDDPYALSEHNLPPNKIQPLIRRLDIFCFSHPSTSLTEAQRVKFAATLRREALGFAVLCNLVYLQTHNASGILNLSIPDNWAAAAKAANEKTSEGTQAEVIKVLKELVKSPLSESKGGSIDLY